MPVYGYVLIALLLLVTNLPYLDGHLRAPRGKVFTTLIGQNGQDTAWYLFQGPIQGARGHWLFEDKCNGHIGSRSVFHPLWLAHGWLARTTGLGVVWLYHAQRIAFALLFYLLLWRFARAYIPDPRWRAVTLLYCATGAGFGWLLPTQSPDTWIIEFNPFLTMMWEPVLPTANVLLLLSAIAILHARTWRACAWCLALSSVYPYAVVNVAALALAWWIWALCDPPIRKSAGSEPPRPPRLDLAARWRSAAGRFRTGLAVALGIAPMTLYDAYVVFTDPYLVSGQDLFDSPSLPLYALAVGVAVPFLLLAMASAFRRGGGAEARSLRPLAVWVAVTFVLIYLPIPFRMQLILGVMIPLSILAIRGLMLFTGWRSAGAEPSRLRIAVAVGLFIALAWPTTIANVAKVHRQIERGRLPDYVARNVVSAIDWLADNSASDDVVLAAAHTSDMVPFFGHNRVFTCSHQAATPDWRQRRRRLHSLVAPGRRPSEVEWRRFFEEYRIRFVLVDPRFAQELGKPALQLLVDAPQLEERFARGKTRVFEVIP
jgi:hypothetical protein